jgi:AraC-like DNA-binding protein
VGKKREKPIDPDAAKAPAFVLEESYEPVEGSMHAHARAQLVHAAEGVITVRTAEGSWVVPPQRAVWVPGGVAHAVSSKKPFRLLTLYVTTGLASVPDETRVIEIDRLVAELLAAAARFGADFPPGGAEERLVRVLLDRLPALDVAPLLHVPWPTSKELVAIARALEADPTDRRTLEDFAAAHKLVSRTAARRFVAETGLTFGQWRSQLRLQAALVRLGGGASVTEVSFAVGYDDVSSFIAAFKAAMGVTPAKYFSSRSET